MKSHLESCAVGMLLVVAASPTLTAGPLETWHTQTAPTNHSLFGVTHGSGLFVAVGQDRSSLGNAILTSPDGVAWTDRSTGTGSALKAVAHGNGIFVAVGDGGITFTSTNGLEWSEQRPASTGLTAVSHGNGVFVAVGSAVILTSSNGLSWISQSLPDFSSLFGVAFGNGFFAVVSRDGNTLTSFDGSTWIDRGRSQSMYAITYGSDLFVTTYRFDGAPPATAFFVSSDGEHWTYRSFLSGYFLGPGLAYGNGMFMVLGDSPGVIAWLDANVMPVGGLTVGNFALRGVGYGRGTFVAVGDGGAILQSDRLPTARLSGGPPGDQGFPLTISGEAAGLSYRLQASERLPATHWTDLLTFTNTGSATNFVDTNATNFTRRFYRVISP